MATNLGAVEDVKPSESWWGRLFGSKKAPVEEAVELQDPEPNMGAAAYKLGKMNAASPNRATRRANYLNFLTKAGQPALIASYNRGAEEAALEDIEGTNSGRHTPASQEGGRRKTCSQKKHRKGSAKAHHKGHRKGSAAAHRKSHPKGSAKAHRKSHRKGSAAAHRKSHRKSHRKTHHSRR